MDDKKYLKELTEIIKLFMIEMSNEHDYLAMECLKARIYELENKLQ